MQRAENDAKRRFPTATTIHIRVKIIKYSCLYFNLSKVNQVIILMDMHACSTTKQRQSLAPKQTNNDVFIGSFAYLRHHQTRQSRTAGPCSSRPRAPLLSSLYVLRGKLDYEATTKKSCFIIASNSLVLVQLHIEGNDKVSTYRRVVT